MNLEESIKGIMETEELELENKSISQCINIINSLVERIKVSSTEKSNSLK